MWTFAHGACSRNTVTFCKHEQKEKKEKQNTFNFPKKSRHHGILYSSEHKWATGMCINIGELFSKKGCH
jgi:hypothetical protein